MDDNLHKGHRARIKIKFKSSNLENFEPHEVLELLLFYAIPQKDTNELAHKLLKKFNNLENVFDAPYELLIKEGGIGDNTAILLKLIPALFRYYNSNKQERLFFKSSKDIANFMMPKFYGRNKEILYVLCLDNCMKIISIDMLFEGDVNNINISWRKVIEYVIAKNASEILLVHNHPSGIPMPSKNDLYFTKKLKEIILPLGINLLDHIIIANNDYASMAEMDMLSN